MNKCGCGWIFTELYPDEVDNSERISNIDRQCHTEKREVIRKHHCKDGCLEMTFEEKYNETSDVKNDNRREESKLFIGS